MGWRYFLYTMGAICLFVFFLRFVVFRFQESPKFLLYRGQDAKAVKVLQHIARFNGRESTITLETFEALTDDDDSLASRDGKKPILGGGSKQMKTNFGQKVKKEIERYKILFATRALAMLTVLIWIVYMFDYWGFSIAGNLFSSQVSKVYLTRIRQAPSFQRSSLRRTKTMLYRARKHTETLLSFTSGEYQGSSSVRSCTESLA